MAPRRLKTLLRQLAKGKLTEKHAFAQLQSLPLAELAEFQATVDTHRAVRTGHPEVILAEWKTAAQVIAIARKLRDDKQTVLITRLPTDMAAQVVDALGGDHDPLSRTLVLHAGRPLRPKGRRVVVVTAGTSDAPVAEEAARTAEVSGARVTRIHDVGVAGLHRIYRRVDAAVVVEPIVDGLHHQQLRAHEALYLAVGDDRTNDAAQIHAAPSLLLLRADA